MPCLCEFGNKYVANQTTLRRSLDQIGAFGEKLSSTTPPDLAF